MARSAEESDLTSELRRDTDIVMVQPASHDPTSNGCPQSHRMCGAGEVRLHVSSTSPDYLTLLNAKPTRWR